MIFSIGNHIRQIIHGVKTQTRRQSCKYQIGRTYAIQPCRTCKGIKEGRILILKKRLEKNLANLNTISQLDAWQEGFYSPTEFETLYNSKYPNWRWRWAYTFRFIPIEEEKENENLCQDTKQKNRKLKKNCWRLNK